MKFKFAQLFILTISLISSGAYLAPSSALAAVGGCSSSVSVSVPNDFSVDRGASFSINWSADFQTFEPDGGTNTYSVTISSGSTTLKSWFANSDAGQQPPTSGSYTVTNGIQGDTDYTVSANVVSAQSCPDGASDSKTVHVTINSVDGGTVHNLCLINSFTADNPTPANNTGTTLHFSFNDVFPWNITLQNGSFLPSPPSGTSSGGTSSTGNLINAQTYRLHCGDAFSDVTVTPNPPDNAPSNPPSVDLKFNGSDGPVNVAYGSFGTISWQVSNATSCNSSGGWSGSKSVSGGTQSSGSLTSNQFYNLSCFNASGSSSDTVEVDVAGQPAIAPPPPPPPPPGSEVCTVSVAQSGSAADVTITADDLKTGWDGTAHEYKVDCNNDGAFDATQWQTVNPYTFPHTNNASQTVSQICDWSPNTTIRAQTRNLYNQATAACTTTINPPEGMSGTITPPAPSCVIAAGHSNCNVSLSWSTTHPVGTSAITSASGTEATGNSGSGVSFTVPYSSKIFYLYNNAVLLDQSNATATCASGSTWNQSSGICASATTPIVTSVSIDCPIVNGVQVCKTDGTKYHITEVSSDPGGGAKIIQHYALVDFQGEHARDEDNGFLSWSSVDSYPGYQNHTACTYNGSVQSSGSFAVVQPGYGNTHIIMDACDVSVSGNNSTMTYQVSFTSAFTNPIIDNDISGYAVNSDSVGSPGDAGPNNWKNFQTNFNIATITTPTVTNVTIDSPTVKADNTTQYGVTVTGSDPGGTDKLTNEYVLINYLQGVNYGYRGFLNWTKTQGSGYAENATCTGAGGGYAGLVSPGDGYGSQYIHLVGCTDSISGTSRSTTFTIRIDTSFTSPITNYLDGYVQNSDANHDGWKQFSQFNLADTSMSGTLVPATSSCLIASGASSCNINFSWHVTNPQNPGGSAVTRNPSNTIVGTGDNGTNVAFSVKYNSETFFLYNNAKSLVPTSPNGAGVTVTSACVSGNAWDGTKCTNIPINGGWAWGNWGACSATTCGTTGTQTRSGTCTNPAPANGGAQCTGSSTQTQSCSPAQCADNCTNGAVNPPACTVNGAGACLNGGTNPPICQPKKPFFKEN